MCKSWIQWLMPVVVTTQEVDIRKIMVSGQHEKGGEVGKIPSQLIKSGMVAPACHPGQPEYKRGTLSQK
jgi:hypothetical protein